MTGKAHFLTLFTITYRYFRREPGEEPMNHSKKSKIEPHEILEKTVRFTVHVDSGDLSILKLYKQELKKPIRTIVHHFIGIAVRCLEDRHDEEIKDLHERVRTQAFIIVKYIEKYGQLRAKD